MRRTDLSFKRFNPERAYRPSFVRDETGEELRFWVDTHENKLFCTSRKKIQVGHKAGKPRYRIVAFIMGRRVPLFTEAVEQHFNCDKYTLKWLSDSWTSTKGTPTVKYWETGGGRGYTQNQGKRKKRTKTPLPPYTPQEGAFDGYA